MCIVKTSLHAEPNSNVNIFLGILKRGGSMLSKIRNKHQHVQAPQHATDRGDQGSRESSGSCSVNGPGGSLGGCLIIAKYCCSVRVCARGQLCGLTSRKHLEEKYLVPISGCDIGKKRPFLVGNCQTSIVSTCSVYRSFCRLIFYISSSMG